MIVVRFEPYPKNEPFGYKEYICLVKDSDNRKHSYQVVKFKSNPEPKNYNGVWEIDDKLEVVAYIMDSPYEAAKWLKDMPKFDVKMPSYQDTPQPWFMANPFFKAANLGWGIILGMAILAFPLSAISYIWQNDLFAFRILLTASVVIVLFMFSNRYMNSI